ncbi:hypothetical protein NUW58_g7373 [Xylaria curta]|uniref:Uncharacterized protein n=1 Tax=Xylaria curta TaxID=42375 RepID=A0ACC1NHP9_9PEZI|nr:hypothetical protein NUW58_g7373 [Xylaria curta]
MNQGDESRPCPIKRLPVELLQMILGALPDVSSLCMAASSCSLFYHVFLQAETPLTTRVLLGQVDVDVLPEAMMAGESALLRPHESGRESYQAILDFVARNLQRRPTPPKSWSLRKALHLSRLHFYVDAFARKFVATTLAIHPLNRTTRPVTPREMRRVERALYRFETYCNLFRQPPTKGPIRYQDSIPSRIYDERVPLFFAHFAPYENEQLGCILDFLLRAISPGNSQAQRMVIHSLRAYEWVLAFADVGEHDVDWGARKVDYTNCFDSPEMQSVVSRGLAKLYEITGAETYAERYQALDVDTLPYYSCELLCESLESLDEDWDGILLEELTPETEKTHVKQSLFNDPDSGPLDAWRWAHSQESRERWVYQKDRRELRQWGYVMWDRARLETADIFQGSWTDVLVIDPVLEAHAYMQNS